MKNKILSIVLILFLLFGTVTVFATEYEIPDLPKLVLPDGMNLTSTDNVEDIINEPMVKSNENRENKLLTEEVINVQNETVNGNLIIFSQNATIQNVVVDGDVVIFAETINITNLTVNNGAIVIAGQNVNLNMISTDGNIYTASKRLNATVMARDLYVAAKEINLGNESQVSKVYDLKDYLPEQTEEEVVEVVKTSVIKTTIYKILSIVVKTAAVAGFIFLFATGFINKTKTDSNAKYVGKCVLKGLIATIVGPIVSIMIMFTGVGAGVGIVIFISYIVVFWASVPFTSIAIMNMITKNNLDNKGKNFGITLLVALAIAILGRIPALGGFVSIFVGLFGMGIFFDLLKTKNNKKDETKANVVEDAKE